MTIMSIGKGKARNRKGKRGGEQEVVYILTPQGTITSSPMGITLVDQFLTKMRDEAHRYANSYRKTLKSKELTTFSSPSSHTKKNKKVS